MTKERIEEAWRNFGDIPVNNKDEIERDMDENDRWYKEKRDLKFNTRCTIGPILMDEEDAESGTVTVEIELANSGAESGINITALFSGGTLDGHSLVGSATNKLREALGEEISLETARRIAPFVDGYYLVTPFGRTALIGRIMERIRQEGLA